MPRARSPRPGRSSAPRRERHGRARLGRSAATHCSCSTACACTAASALLAPVDLVARPGTVTLIEGPSGAGKSSVFAALRGAADFDGVATLGGRDVRDLAPSTWLAWAGQQPGLIAGTRRATTSRSATPRPTRPSSAMPCDLACADDIDPEHDLGVQGAGLSGGQAQRVAVARAFYRHLRGLGRGDRARRAELRARPPTPKPRLWRSRARRLADAGATVLLISHRTSARAIADDVVRLEPSEVVV